MLKARPNMTQIDEFAAGLASGRQGDDPSRAPRMVAVGFRNADGDVAALEWALDEARAGDDMVHVVHVYHPGHIDDCSWPPAAEARKLRHRDADRVVEQALQRLRASHSDLDIDGSAVPGASVDVLKEFSEIVDLMVIGEDTDAAHRPRIAWRTVQSARCPVVSVPADYTVDPLRAAGPVTVLVDTPDVPKPAIEFALAHAERHNSTLCVAQLWPALRGDAPHTTQLAAARRQRLDEQLADLTEEHDSVSVIGLLLLEDRRDTVERLRSVSRLIVADTSSAHLLDLVGPDLSGACPAVLLP